jgi:hypothetical protein
MNNLRHGVRVQCDARCVLTLGDSRHDGILENLSVSGALVRMSGYPFKGITYMHAKQTPQ